MEDSIVYSNVSMFIPNLSKIWKLAMHIMATKLSVYLYLRKDLYNLVLLINSSKIPFITGDQPAINTCSDYINKETKPPEELEIYYPQSPQIAVLLTMKPQYETIRCRDLATEEVVKYNQLIYNASDKQIYANESKVLEDL